MQAWLDHDGQVAPIDLADLEDDLRRGRVPVGARLRYEPWTGDQALPIAQIPQLADAFEAPEACFVSWLRRPGVAWAWALLTGAISAVGAAQLMVRLGVLRDERVLAFFDAAPVGFDELLMAGQWWTPWSSQLSHSGPMHLLPNLGVIAYMGYRVERAYGPASLVLISVVSVATGSLAICLLEDLPAVGSSILGFGLWGAVLAIGFRMGDALSQQRVRGRYGFGSLPIFALLFASTLFTPQATHVGHAFGLFGGMAAAMVLASEAFEPQRQRLRAMLGNLSLAAFVVVLLSIGAPLLGGVTAVTGWPSERVEVEGVGATIDLPDRMAEHPARALGMQAWSTSVNSRAVVFVGLVALRAEVEAAEALAAQWADAVDGELRPVEPGSRWPQWQDHAWEVVDPDTGRVIDRIEEHVLARGSTLLRAGWRLDAPAEPNRQALYDHVLGSLVVGEPPTVVEARERLERNPSSPRMQYELARELALMAAADDLGEADGLLGGLAERDDGWAWDAVRLRLELWARASRRQGADFQGGGEGLAQAQGFVLRWLERAPPLDDQIHRPGVEVLVNTGACDQARAHAEGLRDRGEASQPLGDELLAVVAGCGNGDTRP